MTKIWKLTYRVGGKPSCPHRVVPVSPGNATQPLLLTCWTWLILGKSQTSKGWSNQTHEVLTSMNTQSSSRIMEDAPSEFSNLIKRTWVSFGDKIKTDTSYTYGAWCGAQHWDSYGDNYLFLSVSCHLPLVQKKKRIEGVDLSVSLASIWLTNKSLIPTLVIDKGEEN